MKNLNRLTTKEFKDLISNLEQEFLDDPLCLETIDSNVRTLLALVKEMARRTLQ